MKEMYIIVLLSSWAVGSWADWELQCPVTICPDPGSEEYAINLPHENDCTKFYKCSWGIPILQDCPLMYPDNKEKRLHYNRRLQVCDWPWQAGCERCTKIMNDKCPQADKINTPNNDCTSYIDCEDRNTKSCPKDTCFSRTCQACVSNRANGQCELNGRKLSPLCIEGSLKEHESNYNSYYKCRNGKWMREECSINGLCWNPITNLCDLCYNPKTLRCEECKHNDKNNDKPFSSITTTTATLLYLYGDRKAYGSCNCALYYECINEKCVIQECENGLHYNPKTKMCEPADVAGCKKLFLQ